jgi:hypothetical protein
MQDLERVGDADAADIGPIQLGAATGVLDHRVRVRQDEEVVARAAEQAVVAFTAHQSVLPLAAVERVVAQAADQQVVVRVPDQAVVARIPTDQVGLGIAVAAGVGCAGEIDGLAVGGQRECRGDDDAARRRGVTLARFTRDVGS